MKQIQLQIITWSDGFNLRMVALDFDVIEGGHVTCTFWEEDSLEPGGLGSNDEDSFVLDVNVVVHKPT